MAKYKTELTPKFHFKLKKHQMCEGANVLWIRVRQ